MQTEVLDHGFVRLDGAMADDLSVVNSARVSFAQKSDLHAENCPVVTGDGECTDTGHSHYPRTMLAKKDSGLINFLMRERHGTPFEHNAFRFHVKAPLFVFREWQRHRWSSFNEWSARYSQMEGEFYIPEEVRTQKGKPGAYVFEPLKGIAAQNYLHGLTVHSNHSFERYKAAIASGVAKEQARLLLPVNIYSQMYWTVNARALMNFLSLRNDKNAQWEIRQYAEAVEEMFAQCMPVTHAAFVSNGRVAP